GCRRFASFQAPVRRARNLQTADRLRAVASRKRPTRGAPGKRGRGTERGVSGSCCCSMLVCVVTCISFEQGTAMRRPRRTPLRRYGDPVFDVRDTRGRPGDALGFFALDPGSNRSLEDDLAAVRLDLDAIGIHLGVALERVLDLFLDLIWFDARPKNDRIDNAFDSFD